MDVVGHGYIFTGGYIGETGADGAPLGLGDFTVGGQYHGAVADVAKKIFAVLGANGDKIRPRGCVIVTFQPDGTTVMDGGIVDINLPLSPPPMFR